MHGGMIKLKTRPATWENGLTVSSGGCVYMYQFFFSAMPCACVYS
jgi:hypothetical protein